MNKVEVRVTSNIPDEAAGILGALSCELQEKKYIKSGRLHSNRLNGDIQLIQEFQENEQKVI